MSPHPYKILCFGIVNLLYLLISVIQFFKIIFRRFIHFCKLANFDIQKDNEETFLLNQKIKYP